MNQELETKIKKIKDNLDLLPKRNKEQRKKIIDYIDTNIEEYTNLSNDINNEITRRYNKITNISMNSNLVKLLNDKIDYKLLKDINPNINSYQKMNLDYLLYKLTHFYQDDLVSLNNTIQEIITSFKSAGVILKESDFTYTNYVNIYMHNLLNNKNNIENTLNDIYWKCPDLMIQISLNFRYLYYKNKKKIDKYYNNLIKNNNDILTYETDYNNLYDSKIKLEHYDKKYILDRFINKELFVKDFTKDNLAKLKENILIDNIDTNIYNNLLLLNETLIDYKKILEMKFILDKLKELYKDKNTYKGLIDNKLKEINKQEKQLTKLNNKLNSNNIFIKVNKDEVNLKINNLINDIKKSYDELDSLTIKNTIYTSINDETSLLDTLRITVEDFIFIKELLKDNDNEITLSEIQDKINLFRQYLYEKDNSILTNIKVSNDYNIPLMISDRYKLSNFDIDTDKISEDNISTLLNNIDIILTGYDLDKLNMKIEDINLVISVNKK